MRTYLDEQGLTYLWGKILGVASSKIWVGTTPPPNDSYVLWINQDGTVSGGDTDLSDYYTKAEIDALIGGIENGAY